VSIFVLPPSRRELEWRLRTRSQTEGGQAEEVLRRRLQTAAKEIENYNLYDYIVVNDRLEKSTDELKAIVLSERLRRSGADLSRQRELLETAERCRLQNAGERVRDIVASFALSAAPSS